MELMSRSFTSKEPHVAREPQVADPWSRIIYKHPNSRLLFCFWLIGTRSKFCPTLQCCTDVLRHQSSIYLDIFGAISLKHPFQLEVNCEGSIGNVPFSFLNDFVKLNACRSAKCSKMFLFHHNHMMIRSD